MTMSMRVAGLQIEVHFPQKRGDRGTSLAPSCSWPAHDVADYKDKCPKDWVEMGAPNRGVFFMGVPPVEEGDRELWFNFHPLNSLAHYYAVLVAVQGLNALTGLPISEYMGSGLYFGPGRPVLEQYRDVCPAHGTPLGARRMCEVCGFRWPAQNYLTNAAGSQSEAEFWRDGWRTSEGKIVQFAVRATEAGMGVAQQILGEARTRAIDMAVFRSRNPKPQVRHTHVTWRGGSDSGIGATLGGGSKDFFRGGFEDDNDGGEYNLTGPTPRSLSAPVIRRVGAPATMEVAAGREVNQEIHEDPNPLEFWEPEPVALFTLVPTDQAWVSEVTKNGPTTRVVKDGPFAGIMRVG